MMAKWQRIKNGQAKLLLNLRQLMSVVKASISQSGLQPPNKIVTGMENHPGLV
jgi:hypothetical protein